jgi:hypothetical protein
VNGAEILTTIAQLSMGVTGFSGIAIAFNRQPGRLEDVEAYRVLILFANSLGATFLSLLPFAFFYLGWNDATIWRTSNGLCSLFGITFLATYLPPTRKYWRECRELFSLPQLCFVVSGHLINALIGALGFLPGRALSVFLIGLLWLLFHSVFQFGRILFVQPWQGGAVSRAVSVNERKSSREEAD